MLDDNADNEYVNLAGPCIVPSLTLYATTAEVQQQTGGLEW